MLVQGSGRAEAAKCRPVKTRATALDLNPCPTGEMLKHRLLTGLLNPNSQPAITFAAPVKIPGRSRKRTSRKTTTRPEAPNHKARASKTRKAKAPASSPVTTRLIHGLMLESAPKAPGLPGKASTRPRKQQVRTTIRTRSKSKLLTKSKGTNKKPHSVSKRTREKLITGLIPVWSTLRTSTPPTPVLAGKKPASRKKAVFRKPPHGNRSKSSARVSTSRPLSIEPLKSRLITGLVSPVLPIPRPPASGASSNVATAASALKGKMVDGLITGSTEIRLPPPGLKRKLATGSIAADYMDQRSRYLHDNGPMNLAEVVAKTILENPEIGIARARAQDSKHAIGVARAALFPKIDISLAAGSENTYQVTKNSKGVLRQEASITIRQNLFDFGKTSSDIARAKALLSSAKLHLVDKTDEIVLNVASAYIDVLEARRFVGISRQNVASHKKLFKLVKANEEGGNATAADTKRVASRQESANANLIDVESKLQAAKEEFRKITKLYPGRLAPPPEFNNKTFSNNEAEIEAKLAQNPILLSILEDIKSLRRQLSAAKRGRLPKLTFEGYGNSKKNVSGRNNRAHDFRGMIKLSYSLFDGGAKHHSIMQIKARIQENELRYQKLRNELLQEYKNSAQTANASLSKASSISARLKASAKVKRLYIEQFKAGKRTVFELLDAQTDYFNAQSEEITNTFQSLRTKYKKLRLNGKLVETILGYSER